MRCALIVGISLIASQASAGDWHDSRKVAALFVKAGATGTFVVYDGQSDSYIGYNKKRATTRFVPASTFKIANSLIGLTAGAVASVDDIIPYTGPKEPFIKEWRRDMGLRQAIALSNVPIYQELARRVGLARMSESLVLLNYGNKDIGTQVDKFWLEGPLKISAIEQTRFLYKLAQGKLPFEQQHQKSVQEITLVEREATWELHAKTGWQNAPGPGVGWWVGWVKRDGRLTAFALNIDMKKETDAPKRIELGRASLEALRILPSTNAKGM